MATITAHTLFSDSISVALATGELRTKLELEQEFKKEYETIAFSNYEAFDLEVKTLMSKLEADISFVASIYKKLLTENLLSTKEQVEEVIVALETQIILLDSNIAARKAQLSDVEKFRAYVADEENIAKKRNIDFGMLLSHAKTTAGYLSYVLTVAPEQLTNNDPTSPLTRFKEAKDLLKASLVGYGFGGVSGSTVLDSLETLVATLDASLPILPSPSTVPTAVITQDDYVTLSVQQSVIDFNTLLGTFDLAALTLPQEVILRYFNTFGIENKQRAETILAVEVFQQKMKKTLIDLMLSGRTEIRVESVGADAKLQGYINEIEKKRNILSLKENQLAEAEAKITAGVKDITARVAAVQNFYDNLLRQGTEIMGSYANSVVSSVPANASTVIAEFKEFLDMQEKEIDVRL